MSADRTRAWRQTAIVTAVAIVAYVAIRALPLAGGSLHYTDFHAGEKSFLEFCEPGSPLFAPVDKVRSPVTLTLRWETLVRAGAAVQGVAILTTSTGKPVRADDLLVVHTQKFHLLLVDATLDEYHHVHPVPTSVPGEYAFTFTPQRVGRFRAFADFVPRATGRGLYAGAEFGVTDSSDRALPTGPVQRVWTSTSEGGVVFEVVAKDPVLRINTPADLELRIARMDGSELVLDDIMGAKAHLVAFDAACSGFAHLHPKDVIAIDGAPSERALGFALMVPDPGYYRLWAQLAIDGREVFVPFGLMVEP